MQLKTILLSALMVGILSVALAIGTAQAETPPVANKEPIKVGGLFSTSALPLYIEPAVNAAQMAFDDFNALGGLNGQQVQLIVRDDKGKPDTAILVLEELVNRDKVSAILGATFSHVAVAASEFSKRNKIPTFVAWGSNNDLTWKNGHQYFFSVEAAPDVLAKSQAELLAKLPAKKWVTIAPEYEYGRSMVNAFKVELKKLRPDVEFVAEFWPAVGKFDGGPTINAISHAKPDAIYNVLFASDLGQYIRLGRSKGLLKIPTFHNTLGWPEEAAGLKTEVPDNWYVSGYPIDQIQTTGNQEFIKKYQSRFGTKPNFSAVYSYINVSFYLSALKHAGSTDPVKLSRAAEGLKISSPMGEVTMRAVDHRSTAGYFLGQLQSDGSWKHFERINVDKNSPSDEWIKEQRK